MCGDRRYAFGNTDKYGDEYSDCNFHIDAHSDAFVNEYFDSNEYRNPDKYCDCN